MPGSREVKTATTFSTVTSSPSTTGTTIRWAISAASFSTVRETHDRAPRSRVRAASAIRMREPVVSASRAMTSSPAVQVRSTHRCLPPSPR